MGYCIGDGKNRFKTVFRGRIFRRWTVRELLCRIFNANNNDASEWFHSTIPGVWLNFARVNIDVARIIILFMRYNLYNGRAEEKKIARERQMYNTWRRRMCSVTCDIGSEYNYTDVLCIMDFRYCTRIQIITNENEIYVRVEW